MEILSLGLSSFRIKGKGATVITDPFDPTMVGIKFPKIEADVVTVSHNHDDHNRSDLVGGSPYVIRGPGEYEVKDVTIFGISTFHDSTSGSERGVNTVYQIILDDLTLVHLGDLGHKLTTTQVEEIGTPDVLFIPVGGVYTIDGHEASEIVSLLEPKIVIPMHYRTPFMNNAVFGKLAVVDKFLQEMGKPQTVPQPKLSISKDRLGEELQVVVLE